MIIDGGQLHVSEAADVPVIDCYGILTIRGGEFIVDSGESPALVLEDVGSANVMLKAGGAFGNGTLVKKEDTTCVNLLVPGRTFVDGNGTPLTRDIAVSRLTGYFYVKQTRYSDVSTGFEPDYSNDAQCCGQESISGIEYSFRSAVTVKPVCQ